MVRKQILGFAALVFVAMGVYCPWVLVSRSGERVYTYGWLFKPPTKQRIVPPEMSAKDELYHKYFRDAPSPVSPPRVTQPPVTPPRSETSAPSTRSDDADLVDLSSGRRILDLSIPDVPPSPRIEVEPGWRAEFDLARLLVQWAMLGVTAATLTWLAPATWRCPQWLRDVVSRLVAPGP